MNELSINKVQTKRNNSIDIFRIVCAFMVVMVHIRPFEEANESLSYFFAQIFPRIAVPFFFCVTGYFFIKKLTENPNKDKENLKSTLINLAKLYLFWTLVYFIYYIALKIKNDELTGDVVVKKLIKSLYLGMETHLWFFQAVFVNLILITIANHFKKLKLLAYFSFVLYLIGLTSTAYNGLLGNVPFIDSIISNKNFDLIFRRFFGMGLPFMMMGHFLGVYLNKNHFFSNKKLWLSEILLTLLFLLEIYAVNILNLSVSIIMTIFLYPLLFNTMLILFNNPLEKHSKIGSICRRVSSFIYFSHILVVRIIKLFVGSNSNTLLYVLVVVSCTITGWVLYKFKDNKFVKLFY